MTRGSGKRCGGCSQALWENETRCPARRVRDAHVTTRRSARLLITLRVRTHNQDRIARIPGFLTREKKITEQKTMRNCRGASAFHRLFSRIPVVPAALLADSLHIWFPGSQLTNRSCSACGCESNSYRTITPAGVILLPPVTTRRVRRSPFSGGSA